MGIHLKPGFFSDTSKTGWLELDKKIDVVIRDLNVTNVVDLGYWGQKISLRGERDEFSPLYSIPSPWAVVYLYSSTLKDNTHPLAEKLLVELLNLLSDYSIYDKVELKEVEKPDVGSEFSKFWEMAPEFLKFNIDGKQFMYFFMDEDEMKIVGGLSRASLIWVSQQYISTLTKDKLLEMEELKFVLKYINENIRSSKYGFLQDNFDVFWSHKLIGLLSGTSKNYGYKDNPLFNWLIKITMDKDLGPSKFYDKNENYLVFTEAELKKV